MSKCETDYCKGRTGETHRSPYCPKCRARRWKEKHPVSYHFNKLRNRARERGHEFTLTRSKFAELWESGLRDNHGKTAFSLSIDRINDKIGYRDSNVRLLTLSANSRRRFVPYFKNKAEQEAAIAQTSAAILEAYPELSHT